MYPTGVTELTKDLVNQLELNESSTMTSSSLSVSTDATVVSEHTPDNYEHTCHYNAVACDDDDDCPELIYCSNNLTMLSPKPTGRFSETPVKSLNEVWDTGVGDQVCAIVEAAVPNYSCIDTARFCTHRSDGFTHNSDAAKGDSLGPVTIWVGVPPDSTSADTAHDASQEILALLHKHNIDDVVIEWREAVVKWL